MKIVATIHDAGMAVNVAGGVVESESAIIEIPEENIPLIVKKFLNRRRKARSQKNFYDYSALTFSWIDIQQEK